MFPFRIVQEKRGDAVIGFRVQKQGMTRSPLDGERSMTWRNKGRRVFTMQDAKALRDWLESQERVTHPQIQYEVMPEQYGSEKFYP